VNFGHVIAFVLGAVAMVCFQGRSQEGSDQSQRWIVVSGLAKHLDGQLHCNSTTTGGGIEINGYAAGIYRNSNCSYSLYGARTWLPARLGALRGGGIAGGVTGYGSLVLPVAGLAATYEGKEYGVNLVFVPPYKDSGNVLWLTFKRRW
jgi:hypothetical protein